MTAGLGRWSLLVALALWFFPIGCYRQSPEEARALLTAHQIPFNSFEFVRNAASSPSGVLALFINGHMHPNATTADGYTALMSAARVGNIPNVTFLLKAGASVRPRTQGGITALMMAAQDCTHPESIRMLLNAGSKATDESDDGSTALTFASPPAAYKCDPDVIRELVKAGADPNHVNHHGGTPLMEAIVNDSPSNVTALLELGANPNQKAGHYEWPPILAAVINAVQQHGRGAQIAAVLIKHGADPNALDKFGQSALHHARRNSTLSQLLLDAGATPLPPSANEARIVTYPPRQEDHLLPIDCHTFQKALNLKLPCYGEYH